MFCKNSSAGTSMFGALTYKEECRREDVMSFHMLSFNPAYHQWSKQRPVCVFFSSTNGEDKSHKTHKTLKFGKCLWKKGPKRISCLAAVGIFEASPAPWHVPTFGPTRPAIKRWRNQVVGSVGDSLSLLSLLHPYIHHVMFWMEDAGRWWPFAVVLTSWFVLLKWCWESWKDDLCFRQVMRRNPSMSLRAASLLKTNILCVYTYTLYIYIYIHVYVRDR